MKTYVFGPMLIIMAVGFFSVTPILGSAALAMPKLRSACASALAAGYNCSYLSGAIEILTAESGLIGTPAGGVPVDSPGGSIRTHFAASRTWAMCCQRSQPSETLDATIPKYSWPENRFRALAILVRASNDITLARIIHRRLADVAQAADLA
jgi:hypothetical protein